MDVLLSVLSTVIGGAVLAVVCWLASKTVSQLSEFRAEHEALMQIRAEFESFRAEHEALLESQRNQLKGSIVARYEHAVETGNVITPLALDVTNRDYDSYKALGGNHYVHTLMRRMNEEMTVAGEPLPLD